MSSVSLIDGHIDESNDEQIINALEEYLQKCQNIKYGARQKILVDADFLKGVFDLINCQQAKVEKLNAVSEICGECHKKYAEKIEQAKFEAVKEFEKKFEKKIKEVQFTLGQTWEIQNALKVTSKEMLGE